ncbi:MAG: DnaJ domain-containing protein [Lachnospiraceae bacterium]|nr:DnaJ domain-containing protein [Lachnospiraceae bacterium]
MTDPYKVLGVPHDASNDEIKKQYRKLSRIYHPDANVNNPNKAQAEAKFKEIQQAYTQIMDMRERGEHSDSYGGHSNYGGFGGYGGFGEFGGAYSRQNPNEPIELQAAYNYIRSGHYTEALHVLSNIAERNARWYYLSGMANAGAGNNILALEHARQAVALEPSNQEYAFFLEQLKSGGQWYRSMGQGYGYPSMNMGDCCYKLMLWNLFCGCCCRPC